MLKQNQARVRVPYTSQPPSGGCVLKRVLGGFCIWIGNQPPSGGCVLKLGEAGVNVDKLTQPPSGGCVLKPKSALKELLGTDNQPPSGGCVLKQ